MDFSKNWKLAAGELESLQQKKQLLENQVQSVAVEQQHLANQLTRNGVHQVENSAKQLQIAQVVQTLVATVLASKGLTEVNIYIYLSHFKRQPVKMF